MAAQKKTVNKIAAGMNKDGIEKAIASIKTRGASLDKDIQLTGLSIIAHVDANGEVSLFKKLYDALPAGSRRNALVAWALQFSKIAVNFDKETKKERPFVFDREKATDVQGATEKPWFAFKKEAEPAEAFDLDGALTRFQDMLRRQVKNGKLAADDARVATILGLESDKAQTIGEIVGQK